MPVEVAKLVDDFNKLWPRGTDPVSKADDHIRMIKEVLQLEFELLYNKTRVFSFEAGAVVNPDCILYYEAEKAFYQWNGAYDVNNEYIVNAGSTPTTAGGIGGNAWTRSTGSGFMSTVLVSDTEPTAPFQNMLWWDTNSGTFFIYYNDGTSTQWVDLFGIADQSTFNALLFRSILARLAAESGYTLVGGSFQEGAVSSGFSDVVLDWNTAKFYQWHLNENKEVPAGSTPETTGGIGAGAWVDRTDETLRGDLAEDSGAAMIGGIGFTVAEAFDGSNDTEILQAAVNSAISSGHSFVKFNRDYVVSGEILNRQEVIFVGSHNITGAGSYRMRIVRGDEKSMPTLDGIVAAQLPSFSSKLNPIVVVVGDSITTPQPNSVDAVNTQYQIICNKIKADNPGRDITFYNRGIGGMGFFQLDGVASSGWPDWYTTHTDPWLNYVSNLNPDLVIVSMGMNDSSDNISFNAIESVIAKIRAMASKPDVVMVTCAVPSTNPGATYQAKYGSKAGQEGRDYAAGLVRAACVKNAVPCIDVNRVFNVVRDGFDIIDSRSKILAGAAASGGGYLSPIECRNWSAVVGLSGRAAYTGTDPLAVKVGPKGTEVCFIKINGSFQLQIECYNAPQNNYATYTLADQVVPDAVHQLQVEVYNQRIRAFVVGSTVDSKPDFKNLYVGGGLYFPGIGKYDANYRSGTLSSVDQFAYGEHTKYLPSITNNEMWGVGDGSAGTKLPYGGNGINHPSSIGAQAVWGAALSVCDFSCRVDGIFSHNQGGGYKIIDGVVREVWGRWTTETLAAQINSSIQWPVAVSGTLSFVASPGINSETLDATLRSAQTIVTHGRPKASGIDITVHCLTQTGCGRFVDWVLFVT